MYLKRPVQIFLLPNSFRELSDGIKLRLQFSPAIIFLPWFDLLWLSKLYLGIARCMKTVMMKLSDEINWCWEYSCFQKNICLKAVILRNALVNCIYILPF